MKKILSEWNKYKEQVEEILSEAYVSLFGDEFKLKRSQRPSEITPKLKKHKVDVVPPTPTPPTPTPDKKGPEAGVTITRRPDWKADIGADMSRPAMPADRLKIKTADTDLPVKVKVPSLRTKHSIRSDWGDAREKRPPTASGRIGRKYADLKDSGFRFGDFYKALKAPEMKGIRRILGTKDNNFGRRHARAMKAYVKKVGSYKASRQLGVDELKLKKMFGPKMKKGTPGTTDPKDWTRIQGGSLRVPDKFVKRATSLAVKSGTISAEQAVNLLKAGLTYDPRTGKIAAGKLKRHVGQHGSNYSQGFGAEAVKRLAGLYATRGYNISDHQKKTGHARSPISSHELSDKIKYLKSKIKGGKLSAMRGTTERDKWGDTNPDIKKRDFDTARRLMKDYGSLAAWKREHISGRESQVSLSPRVRKIFSDMSLDRTLGFRAIKIAKNPKYTLAQLIDMRQNRSGPEGLRVSSRMRRKQALLDRAIILRQAAAAGERRAKLPGGISDISTKGILGK